ncbi:uncharacterized protein AB675_8117 [Cyphellophora attinorum]|uniref:Uncharacterized protein n=1 Tax=Cyphellophora attinorum TaxID=1664694 RepID=A0A0N1HVA6_9EURO|nr:uncharacterized protein AB675_8117 [Phialophora attinorum]KPI41160.1 hypothetical protein AB675_8117 [Phialophora attinorum]
MIESYLLVVGAFGYNLIAAAADDTSHRTLDTSISSLCTVPVNDLACRALLALLLLTTTSSPSLSHFLSRFIVACRRIRNKMFLASILRDINVQEEGFVKRKRDASDIARVAQQNKKMRLCTSNAVRRQPQHVKKGITLDTLPGEIRNRIYEYVFEASEITIFYCAPDPAARKADPPIYLEPNPSDGRTIAKFRDRDNNLFAVLADKHTGYGITQVSRQLHNETRELFFHRSTFSSPDQNLTGVFCTHMPPDWKQHVRSFSGSIVGPYPKYHHILPTDASHFLNLQSVTLTAPMDEREDFHAWYSLKSLTQMSTEELKEEFLPASQQLPLSALDIHNHAAYRRRVTRAAPRYWPPTKTTSPATKCVAAHALIDTRADLNWSLRGTSG